MSCKKCSLLTFILSLLILHVRLLCARHKESNYNSEIDPSNSFDDSSLKNNEQLRTLPKTANRLGKFFLEQPPTSESKAKNEEAIPAFLYLSQCQRSNEDEGDAALAKDPFHSGQKTHTLDKQTFDEEISTDFSDSPTYNHDPPLELPHCSELEDNSKNPIIIVSTLDGQITGINFQNGAVLWSHKTGDDISSLLSSSMAKMEVTSRGEWVRLIPSLDGGIFRFDGENVEALPVTAETLLHSSFKLNEETIFTGGRTSELIGIAPDSGALKYTCSSDGCHYEQSTIQSPITLLIKRITQTVRAIDPRNGNERWNFSVGLHEVNVAGGGCESAYNDEVDGSLNQNIILQFILPDGVIRGMAQNTLVWQQKLASPIADAWLLEKGRIKKVDLFSSTYVPALVSKAEDEASAKEAAMYVGINNKQFYVQRNSKMTKRPTAYTHYIAGSGLQDVSFPKVHWKPYLATALSRTPVIHHSSRGNPLLLDYNKKQHSSDLIIRDTVGYPFDNGFYLFGNGMGDLNDSDSWATVVEGDEGLYFDEGHEEDSILTGIQSNVWHLLFHLGYENWKEVAIFLCLCVLAHAFAFRYFYLSLRRTLGWRAAEMMNAILHNVFRENRQILLIIQRMGLDIRYLPPPPPVPIPPESTPAVVDSNHSSQADSQSADSTFSSRYLTDFEPVRCLGKGGFGVVFHMRNKLDENEYAVKRIILPLKESSANRVKREVRALAKLNHTNIVRYYNSWLETPPMGWQDSANFCLTPGETSSSLPSPGIDMSDFKSSEVFLPQKDQNAEGKGAASLLSDSLNLSSQFKLNSSSNDSHSICFLKNESRSTSDCDDSTDDGTGDSGSVSRSHSGAVCFTNNLSKEEGSFDVVFENSNCDISDHPSKNANKKQRDIPPASIHLPLSSHPTSKSSCNINDNNNRPSFSREAQEGQVVIPMDTSSRRRCKKQPASVPRTFLYIQMELCKKESLKDWLSSNPIRDLEEVFSIFNDIIHAVEYVHDRQLIHRDLKPSNIFFSLDGQVKIGDFGLVTTIEDEKQTDSDHPTDHLWSSEPQQRTHEVGTRLYMSPEQISGASYDYKIDIFSLGLIFYEMMVAFGTEMERRTVLLKVRDQRLDQEFTTKFPHETSLLCNMLHPHPSKRPTTRGVRVSPPLSHLQKDLASIKPEDHFKLNRTRQSSGQSESFSESASTTNSSHS